MTVTIETMVARWDDPASCPLFKNRLVDDDGHVCAQGDVLRLCGWDDMRLRSSEPWEADKAVSAALGISLAHAVLLRNINDRASGCPQDVLAHPEKILGTEASRVIAFWRRLDVVDWTAAKTASKTAAKTAAWAVATAAAMAAAWTVAGTTAAGVARVASKTAAKTADWDAARAAAWASNEIQGASELTTFYFLPVFGINHPSELDQP